jgi:MerR family copper efflux transcriptional regulator
MTAAYKIADVARRSGFNASTLRYYEEVGLLPPADRSAAGYRLYDDSSLARLAFISRAKQLGCTLEEITDLTVAWDGERCEPIQVRLRELVAAKIAEAQERITEMVAFAADLQSAALALVAHTPDGPCDADCGCASPAAETKSLTPVKLTNKSNESALPIACTLLAQDMAGRLAHWQKVLSTVTSRQTIPGGLRLRFADGVAVGELAELTAAEQTCCAFFDFAITMRHQGVALEVVAPDDATDLVRSLFGAAA